MKLYLIVIAVAVIVIGGVDCAFVAPDFGISGWKMYGTVGLAVVVEIALLGITASLVRALPKKWFAYDRKFFAVSAKEKKFYEKLKIRKWKDKLPDLDLITSFKKNKISDPKSNEYLERYMLEAAYGELGHMIGVLTGFLVIVILPLRYWYSVTLPVAIIAAVLSILPTMSLRYNFYKLKVLHDSNVKKAARRKAAEAVSE